MNLMLKHINVKSLWAQGTQAFFTFKREQIAWIAANRS